ncbi:threonine dehydrogenase-like Zn-dependent dehydrogenase [Arthrobacter sp. CAN_A212]|uniref:zinc-dependent alcohol dehydrogenase n=1 Tax=Arthrobacter sp. CAN_A212 TaxID=2787719 RepID=UPI0018C9A65E
MSRTSPHHSQSYWTTSPGHGELRTAPLPPLEPGQALVRTLYSGISRGTETLVHDGRIPPEIATLMEAPFQEGSFDGPVKYGYLSVGLVEDGPASLVGRRVFCLYPHQDRYVVPVDALTLIPDDVPSERAVLAGAVETAVNALWDSRPCIGDRIAVVGGGMIGAAIATLLRRFPLARLQLVDLDPTRAALAEQLGVDWVHPDDAAGDCDLVFHCSSTAAGLSLGLGLLGDEGEVIELSWYGTHSPEVPLGADFHARRLSIRASQVGTIAAPRRARRTHQDRLTTALEALKDPAFDALLSGSSPFEDLPNVMRDLSSGTLSALCHVIAYPGADTTA